MHTLGKDMVKKKASFREKLESKNRQEANTTNTSKPRTKNPNKVQETRAGTQMKQEDQTEQTLTN